MADTTFTCLGMSGAGKTCYVLGMYYEMRVGTNGFTITTTNEAATKLDRLLRILKKTDGMDRFPTGTPLHELIKYSFQLHHGIESILSFDWIDYGGGTLEAREENLKIFKALNSSIEESTALYIFVDGELFCDPDQKRRRMNIRDECAGTINPYITKYYKDHDGVIPPIIFVITKTDLCKNYTNPDEIRQILHDSFSSVFCGGITSYIVPVSLGNNISDNNYSGYVEPVNIHLPFFIGVYHQFFDVCKLISHRINEANDNLRNTINKETAEHNREENKWFKNKARMKRIKNLEESIQTKNKSIEENNNLLNKYRRLLKEVSDELMRNSNAFNTYVDGKMQDFKTESI